MKFKVFAFSLLLALILTFFSGHWYLKSDFWKTRTPVQEMAYLQLIIHNNTDTQKPRYERREDVKQLKLSSDDKPVSINALIKFSDKKIIFSPIISFYPNEQKYNIKILSNVNDKILIHLPYKTAQDTKIAYKSFLINNQEQLGNFKNNSMTLDVAKGDIINMQLTADRTPPPANMYLNTSM